MDLVLLVNVDALDRGVLKWAIEATFAAMARESQVELSLDEALGLVGAELESPLPVEERAELTGEASFR